MKEYLQPTEFLNFDDESVREFATRNSAGAKTEKEKAVKLYYAVRDGFQYNPNILDLRREGLKASDLLKRNRGYCVEKAVLLAASARSGRCAEPSEFLHRPQSHCDRQTRKTFAEKLSRFSRRGGTFSRREMAENDSGI